MYEAPRFMSIGTAIEQLLEVGQKLGESGRLLFFFVVFPGIVISSMQSLISYVNLSRSEPV